MSNKQLLALAAKAHGGLLYIEDMNAWIHVDKDGNRGAWWNPLHDGDAFKLAEKLEMCIDFSNCEVHYRLNGDWGCELGSTEIRLAIVRAAAKAAICTK